MTKAFGDSMPEAEYRYLYNMWQHIKNKCFEPTNAKYHLYGGRGITVCKEWADSYASFKEWILANLGDRPSPGHSLDRRDNNGHYEPGNVRWATDYEQSINMRTHGFYSADKYISFRDNKYWVRINGKRIGNSTTLEGAQIIRDNFLRGGV